MARNTHIPKGIGRGEGGGRMQQLERILQGFEERISELEDHTGINGDNSKEKNADAPAEPPADGGTA